MLGFSCKLDFWDFELMVLNLCSSSGNVYLCSDATTVFLSTFYLSRLGGEIGYV